MKKQVLFRVAPETDTKIDAIARRLRMVSGDAVSRSQVIEKLVTDCDLEKLHG
jgi:hypothetical protein